MREAKLALVVKRLMFGNLARVFAGWRLIPQRNKRFFRKQQALKRAIAAGDETIKRKRKALVATAWRGWRCQMVDQEKMALVKKMLAARLSTAKGTFFGSGGPTSRRSGRSSRGSPSAKELRKMLRRTSGKRRAQGAAEMEKKLAKAMEWAFGASSMTMSKWRAAVAEKTAPRDAAIARC